MEDRIVKAITQSNTLPNDNFNLRLDCSASEILSHASSHHPGQGPLPNLDPYMDKPAQLLSSCPGVQHSISSSDGNETSTRWYQKAVQILMHGTSKHSDPSRAGYAYNQMSMVLPTYQTPSQQVFTSPDNVSSAPTCSYSIDQFLDDIQLQSSQRQCVLQKQKVLLLCREPQRQQDRKGNSQTNLKFLLSSKNLKQHLILLGNSLW